MKKLKWDTILCPNTFRWRQQLRIDNSYSNIGYFLDCKITPQFGMDPLDELCCALRIELIDTDLSPLEIESAIALLKQGYKNA